MKDSKKIDNKEILNSLENLSSQDTANSIVPNIQKRLGDNMISSNQNENNEQQPILGIIKGKESTILGDATITTDCHFNPETVNFEDGINLILNGKGKSEWGTIRVYKNFDGKQYNGCIATIEYNNGTITSEKGYIAKDQKVKLIRSNGGRGSMDYYLCLSE